MLEINGGNLFDLLTTQGSVFSAVFVVTPALAYGCVWVVCQHKLVCGSNDRAAAYSDTS